MSESEKKNDAPDYRIPESDTFWSGLTWKASLVVALVGGALSAFGFSNDAERFGYSYLFGFIVVTTIVLGGIFYCAVTNFTAGHWGVTARRMAEVAGSAAPLLLLLFIPLAGGVMSGTFTMYDEWLQLDHGDHGDHEDHGDEHEGHDDHEHEGESAQEHEEHGALDFFTASTAHAQDIERVRRNPPVDGIHTTRTSQEHAAHHHVLHHKASWLSGNGWLIRGVVYLAIWILLGFFFFFRSLKQDTASKEERFQINREVQSRSAFVAIAFGLTLTFAAFDWVMSLEPSWYSTIFGVTVFAGSAVAILALQTFVGISLYQKGHVGEALNVEHFHDLGKLLFGFMCFWAYVCFSQWMLIWYAGIPEEAVWYLKRWGHGWKFWSLMLGFGHFVIPFYLMMSRLWKRRLPLMKLGAIWLFILHICDVYWLVLPQYGDFSLNAMDIGALLLCLGLFFAYFFRTLTKHPLIPVGDPRLQRCIHHHQTY